MWKQIYKIMHLKPSLDLLTLAHFISLTAKPQTNLGCVVWGHIAQYTASNSFVQGGRIGLYFILLTNILYKTSYQFIFKAHILMKNKFTSFFLTPCTIIMHFIFSPHLLNIIHYHVYYINLIYFIAAPDLIFGIMVPGCTLLYC